MLKPRDGASFDEEALARGVSRLARGEEFDGDKTVEEGILSQEDLPHGPAAQGLHQTKLSDKLRRLVRRVQCSLSASRVAEREFLFCDDSGNCVAEREF